MKKVFILCIAFSAIFTSCEQKKTEKSATSGGDPALANGACCDVPIGEKNFMDSVAMEVTTANAMIKRLRDSIQTDTNCLKINGMPRRTSIIMNADAIRQYLDADIEIHNLLFVFTLTDSGLSAVTIGQKEDPITFGMTPVYFHKKDKLVGITENVFDMMKPCPVCDNKLFTQLQPAKK